MRKLNFLFRTVLLLCALVGGMSAWAQSDYSAGYEGNVTLSTAGGTSASTAKVIVTGTTEYNAIKAGASKTAGAVKITVPEDTKYLHLHVAAWNGETVTLSVKQGTTEITTISLTADTGVSGSGSTYTLGTPANATTNYYKVITFTNALTADTDLTFTATGGKRFVVWGVTAEILPTSIVLDKTSLDKTAGDDPVTLTATVSPSTATDKTVTWQSSNSSVASVTSSGVVSFNSAGNATITAKTVNNLSATCEVTVVAGTNPTASLSTNSLVFGDVEVNQEKEMTFTVTPANLTGSLTIACDNDKYIVSPTSIAQDVNTAQTITVTAAPTSLIDDMDGTITISGGDISAQTVTLTASPFKKYVVSFSDGGSLTETSKNSGVVLPSRANNGDNTFVGWSESEVSVGSTNATTIDASETYYPANDITLYPVYSYIADCPVEQWSEIATLPTDGEYVIASDNNYAMKASVSSSRFENENVTIIAGSPAKLSATPEENYIWEISKPDTYYRIKNGTKYAGGTSSKNQGALLTDADADLAKWTITYDNGFAFENYGRSKASNDSGNKWLRNNGSSGWGTYSSTQDKAPRLFKKGYVSGSKTLYTSEPVVLATLTLNSACTDGKGHYYGTYSNSSAFVVPSDLVVSEISVIDGKLYVENYATDAIVPANTGVMVSALTAGNYSVTLASGGTSVLGTDNMLKATGDGITAADMTAADTKFYRLTMHNGTEIGFYWGAASGAAFDLGANKAYLAVPDAAAARITGFSLFGNETTAINEINAPKNNAKGEFFNLNGQRVNTPKKGLYIQNGKKYVIK